MRYAPSTSSMYSLAIKRVLITDHRTDSERGQRGIGPVGIGRSEWLVPFLPSETENGAKAFLLEVMIIGQDLRQALSAHGYHRNTIREAIAFVGAGIV